MLTMISYYLTIEMFHYRYETDSESFVLQTLTIYGV